MNLFLRIYKFFQKLHFRIITGIRNKAVLRRLRKHKEQINYEQRIQNISNTPVAEIPKLVEEMACALTLAELKPLLNILKTKSKRTQRVIETHELEAELSRLNSNFIKLDLKQREIQLASRVNTNLLDSQIQDISSMIENYNSSGKAILSYASPAEFIESSRKLDNIFSNLSTIKRFSKREKETRQKRNKERKIFQTQLETLQNLVRQNNLSEAQKLISILEINLPNTDFHHHILVFEKIKVKFHDRELANYQQQQKELFKKLDEEANRLRKAEGERNEALRILKENKELLLKQKQEAQQTKTNALKSLLSKKTNWTEFRNVLNTNNISTLYHFTDRANLKSIKDHNGLYSWQYCERNGIHIPQKGGDTLSRQLDTRYQLQDYVRLSFCQSHPMMYIALKENRIQDAVILKISPEICFLENTTFSDMNATDNSHKRNNSPDFLNSLNFEIFKRGWFDLHEREKKYYQAEILVKTWIPIDFITNINDY